MPTSCQPEGPSVNGFADGPSGFSSTPSSSIHSQPRLGFPGSRSGPPMVPSHHPVAASMASRHVSPSCRPAIHLPTANDHQERVSWFVPRGSNQLFSSRRFLLGSGGHGGPTQVQGQPKSVFPGRARLAGEQKTARWLHRTGRRGSVQEVGGNSVSQEHLPQHEVADPR